MFNQTLNVAEATNENGLSVEYLTFRLGDEEYGVDIYQVQELRRYDSVTRIANAKEYVKGVINLRGTIVLFAIDAIGRFISFFHRCDPMQAKRLPYDAACKCDQSPASLAL